MLRPPPSLVVVLLLVGQGLLVTSGLWHRHGPRVSGEALAAGDYAGCHHHHDDPGERPAEEPAPEPPSEPHDGHDCAICLALATQRIELTAASQAGVAAPLVARLGLLPALAPAVGERAPPRSRGPPAFNCA